jgi:hypothetical protein
MPSRSPNKISLILYEQKNVPRYIEIDKRLLRLILFIMPLITLVSLSLLIGGVIYFKKGKQDVVYQESKELNDLKDSQDSLNREKEQLLKEIDELQSRLSSAPTMASTTEGPGNALFQLIRTSNGYKDLTAEKLLSIQEIKTVKEINDLMFSFTMANSTPEEKTIAGHAIVIMRTNDTLQIYPTSGLSPELQFPYNNGETFSFTRLRPVNARFNLPANVTDLTFRILIFSRTGDLIYHQLINQKL